MLARIRSILSGDTAAPKADDGADPMAAAAVAMLVEAASIDGDFDADERRAISGILVDRFALSAEDAAALIDDVAGNPGQANTVYAAARTIRDGFTEDERVDVMEMLWQVAYADGELHDYEANLVRRIAGLLYVKDQDSGRARKRALSRLGLDDTE